MATNFPTSLDTSTELPAESASTPLSTNHVTAHQNIQDAIEAIEAKVGINSSAVATSLDYKVTNTSSSNPGHKHTLANGATDVTATTSEVNKLAGLATTAVELGYVSGVTSAIQTQLGTKVNNTGNETIAGIKTFSSDPLIPDEAYSSSWNGVLEPPTKNAVYDKIESLPTPLTDIAIIPQPISPQNGVSTRGLSNNVDAYAYAFTLERAITVNKISLNVTAVGTSGTINIGVFSQDGQTRHISVTTATISGTGVVTTSVSSVSLSAGIYYIVFGSVSTADITFSSWLDIGTISVFDAISSEPRLSGQLTVTASTMPSTFSTADSGTFQNSTNSNIVFRLDN